MARATKISEQEMKDFLFPQGFQIMTLPGTTELIFGRIVKAGEHKISQRVYTTIYHGRSLAKGEKAMQVRLFFMRNGNPVRVGKEIRCLRVEGWRDNLGAAITNWQSEENFKICPTCKAPMVWREPEGDKKFEPFFGCVFYPKCKGPSKNKPNEEPAMPPTGTMPAPQAAPTALPPAKVEPVLTPRNPVIRQHAKPGQKRPEDYRIPAHLISPAQKQAEEFFINTPCAMIFRSRAGGGKTALLKHLASFRREGERMQYVAFNKKNAREAARKMPPEVTSTTTHSFLLRSIRENLTVDKDPFEGKNAAIMEEIYPGLGQKPRRRIRKATFKMIGLAKAYACKPTDTESIRQVMGKYTFELDSDKEEELVVELTAEALGMSLPEGKYKTMYCFDDMLWWPIVCNLPLQRVNTLLNDEVQDYNECQLEMCRRLQEEQGTRIIGVGDDLQAVYRFRGAQNDSFDRLKGILQACRNGFKEVVLPTCYRCGIETIEYVKAHSCCGDIEAAKDAPHSKIIENLTYDMILDMLVGEFGQLA